MIELILICKETIYAWEHIKTDTLFTKHKAYEFIPVDNRYTRVTMKEHNLIGYIKKDDEKYKRWISNEFKEQYFKEYGNSVGDYEVSPEIFEPNIMELIRYSIEDEED
jgi:hypothetical protein